MMNKLTRFATPLMAVALMSGASFFAHAQTSQTQNSAVQEWNTPPAGTEQTQLGFRDGLEAAKLDKAAKRKIDAQSSYLYLHPPVKGAAKDEYRASFAAGYQAAMKHQSQGGE